LPLTLSWRSPASHPMSGGSARRRLLDRSSTCEEIAVAEGAGSCAQTL
jgi:hypothetical protein